MKSSAKVGRKKSMEAQNLEKIDITKTLTPNKQPANQHQKSVDKDYNTYKAGRQNSIYNESNRRKSDDFISYINKQIEELDLKRHKMQGCIDLFNLMHSNNMQLRCMQHNNILTLYCFTQRRILCVNCTYGAAKHRTHKVLPLKDSTVYVSEDNNLLRELIDKDLSGLEDSLKNNQENIHILESQMKKFLDKFQDEYERKFQQLKTVYQKQKQSIKLKFQTIIGKTRVLEKNIEQFKFKIWQTLSKIGIGKRNQNSNNQTDVMRQVFCVSLSEITNFRIKIITKRELQKLLIQVK